MNINIPIEKINEWLNEEREEIKNCDEKMVDFLSGRINAFEQILVHTAINNRILESQ